mmetsp:Transcript_1177/g.1917  ORF Transcript_1177/g.1917 Transcript_1177/m.1917 type:complete len:420 (+) Transcript_1177:31-1290(+)
MKLSSLPLRSINYTLSPRFFSSHIPSQSLKDLDIVIYGATGFTGRLVSDYMNTRYGVNKDIKWAMAGRNKMKLQEVRDELSISPDVPLIVADASNKASLDDLVSSTRVVLTTVGPYQLYGNELVAACASAGTDYVDLCGEPAWMHDMINAHSTSAESSGARILFSCGFDSIPFDMGVYYLQQVARRRFGRPVSRVRGRVRGMQGGWSGGTLASFQATMAAAEADKSLLDILRSPFALTPGFEGPKQPSGGKPLFDEVSSSWVAPFMMAPINTKNIHRSNFLLGHEYGENFVYDEMILTGSGEKGEKRARAIATSTAMQDDKTPPGEGPSKEERDNGFYDVLFVGTSDDDSNQIVRVSVHGDMDPGYGSTSKMIAETAVCLVKHPGRTLGGIWTCAPALGIQLIDRLQNNAGISFIDETD